MWDKIVIGKKRKHLPIKRVGYDCWMLLLRLIYRFPFLWTFQSRQLQILKAINITDKWQNFPCCKVILLTLPCSLYRTWFDLAWILASKSLFLVTWLYSSRFHPVASKWERWQAMWQIELQLLLLVTWLYSSRFHSEANTWERWQAKWQIELQELTYGSDGKPCGR